jgi:methionyl-tRNA formyltransferase
LQHDIDTGNILLRDSFPIGAQDTAGDVHDRMKEIGARLLVKTIDGLAAGTIKESPQPAGVSLKHAPKIFTDTCRIDWTQSTDNIYNLIRGLSPFPTAFTTLDGKMLKIFRAEKDHTRPGVPPGGQETDKKSYLKFAAADGYILVRELQLEGKKKMTVEDFLRGYK